MTMRIRFLPAFFVSLAIVLAIAIVWRIRQYTPEEGGRLVRSSEDAGTVAAVTTSRRSDADAMPEAAVEERTGRALSSSDSPREQRLRELLALPPPEPPRPGEQRQTTSEAPSPQSQPQRARSGAPAAPPASGGAPKGPTTIAHLPQPIASGSSQSQPQQQPQNPPQRQKEKDPTSDSTPPQLIAIEFAPPQVRDGEEIALAIGATDDISGVRNISGSIASPTGGLLGFALTRDPADPSRYTTRVAVPREAPEGVWRINYLHLTDNAGNPAVLSYNQGSLPPSATFRVVSSRPDATAPVLKAVWLDRRAMKAGERNTVFIQADDDRSGVALVSGVFHSPSKLARVGFGCRNAGASWECDLMPPLSVDCGDWQLEQLQLQDKANNSAAMRADNPLVGVVKLNIMSDQCDSQPPALLTLALDTTHVSNVQDNVVTITATAADDLSGVSSVSGHIVGPAESGNPPRLFFSMSPAGDQETWVGRVTVPKSAAKGIWAVGSVQMLDKANNLKIYSRGESKLAGVQFRVD